MSRKSILPGDVRKGQGASKTPAKRRKAGRSPKGRRSNAGLNALLAETDPKFDELKAGLLRELGYSVILAERRLNALIEAFARSQRAEFQIIDGGQS